MMDVVAYSTKNYKHITGLWKRSQVFANTFLNECGGDKTQSYVECIESKIQNLIEFVPKSDFIISSDVDVVFLSSNMDLWKNIAPKKGILFMRDAVKTNLNAGFFIVKRDYFETKLKQFLAKMLLDKSWKTLEHYEQSYMNKHLPRDDWDFIPDEYTYMPHVENTMSRVLFYHAICVPDKYHAMELALKTKKYQVHVCFHDGVEDHVESVLYRHPYMIPYRLHSTKYYESEFFMNVDVDDSADYIGMVTYKIIHKSNLLKTIESSNADVITFHVLPTEKIEDTDKHHPKFTKIWKRLTERLGVSPQCCDPMFFRNYWVAKPHVLREYQKFIQRAAEILEEDPDVYENAHYKEGTLSKERLVEITGRPYYTYHPFVLERLPCLFVKCFSYSFEQLKL